MPTNPNIILSGNQMAAPRLPDVNAMLQTRTAGMENIYNIEQQRAEQARIAQKEQEAALVDALAPAYATAFKGGGSKEAITAAYNLLPPEIQAGVKGQIDKLLAMPSDELRLSALEASMAGSEAGRTLLNRIPTALQQQQEQLEREKLSLSRDELALRRTEANKPEIMTPKYRTVETAQGIFLLNENTGELVPATAAPSAIPAPDGGPISVQQPPQVLQPKLSRTEAAAASESERTAGYNAGRALNAAVRIADAVKTATDADAPGSLEAALGIFVDPNIVRGEERQRVAAAQRDLIDALLTLATGAAYNREQLEGQMQSYIPRWSDEEGTRNDKRRALLDLISAAKIKAGRAWTPEMDATFNRLLEPSAAGASAAPPAPAPPAIPGVIDFNDLGD